MTTDNTPEIEPVDAAVTAFLVNGAISPDDVALLRAQDAEDLQSRTAALAEELGAEDPHKYANRAKLLGSAAAGSTHLWEYIQEKPEITERGDVNYGAPGASYALAKIWPGGRTTRPHSTKSE